MIPSEKQRSYLARQLGTLALSQVRTPNSMALLRAAAWHNVAARLGVCLPFFVIYDLGLLLTATPGTGGITLAANDGVLQALRLPRETLGHLSLYRSLLEMARQSEIFEKTATWRVRDDLIGVLIVKILGDVYQRWPDLAKRVGAEDLPLQPMLYEKNDLALLFSSFDSAPVLGFLRFLVTGNQPLHVYTAVEQIDVDTVRLLSMFTPLGQHGGGLMSASLHAGSRGAQLDLVDLLGVFQSVEASNVVQFSFDLLPSVLETKRASAAQVFSANGYASIERQGSIDSLMLSELAHDDEMFLIKLLEKELFYFGHEKQPEEQRRLQYILVDASPSMRGLRQIFARGLALTLAKKLGLQGDEVWMRFFDARLYDVVRFSKNGADYATPYVLSFRTDRGRNYSRVFRQFLLELQRLRREARRQVVVYIITHGQCHIPVETAQAMAKMASLYGVFILPSTEVQLDYLQHLHRHQVVNDSVLTSQKDRRDRALQIVEDAAHQRDGTARRGGPPWRRTPSR